MTVGVSVAVKLANRRLIIVRDDASRGNSSLRNDACSQALRLNLNLWVGIYLHIDQSKRRRVARQLLHLPIFISTCLVATSLGCFFVATSLGCSFDAKIRRTGRQADRRAGRSLSCRKEGCIEGFQGWQFRFLAFLYRGFSTPGHLKRVEATIFLSNVGRLVLSRVHYAFKVVFSLLFELLLENPEIFL